MSRQCLNNVDRDILREKQRRERAQLVEHNMLAKETFSQPIFGAPVKIDPNKEDETSRRIKKALGDFTRVQQYLIQDPKHLIGISQSVTASQPPLDSNTASANLDAQQQTNAPKTSINEAGIDPSVKTTVDNSCVESVQREPQTFNGQHKVDSTLGTLQPNSPNSLKFNLQSKKITVKVEEGERNSQPKTSPCVPSKPEKKVVTTSPTSCVTTNNVEEETPSNAQTTSLQVNRFNSKLFQENYLSNGNCCLPKYRNKSNGDHKKVNLSHLQGKVCEGNHGEVEHILKEMKQPLPPPLSAIETPQKEESQFRFFPSKEKLKLGSREVSGTEVKENVEEAKDGNGTQSQMFSLQDDLVISDSDDETVTSQSRDKVKARLNFSSVPQNGDHCPASLPQAVSASSDSRSSDSEDSSSDTDSEDTDSSASNKISASEKPPTQSWRLANFVDKQTSSPWKPLNNLSVGEEQLMALEIQVDHTVTGDTMGNSSKVKENEGFRSSSTDFCSSAGFVTTDVRVMLSPVHEPNTSKQEEPFSSIAQQCQDDKVSSRRSLDVKDNILCSSLRNGDQTSLGKTEEVDTSYKGVITFQPSHTVKMNSGSSPLSKKRLEFKLDNSSSFTEQKFDLALPKVHGESVKNTLGGMKHREKLTNSNGITGQKIGLELLMGCEDVKNIVGKKKHIEELSSCIKYTEGGREGNKINRKEIKHRKRTLRESTPKSGDSDLKKHGSVHVHNDESNEMIKRTPEKCLSRSDDSDVDILTVTSPVQLLSTSNKVSASIQPSATTLVKHSKETGIRLKSKDVSGSVLKVTESVVQRDSVKSIQSQNETKQSTIPHIVVSISCDLIDRIPPVPLKLSVKRTYSPEDSDIKIRTEDVAQFSSNKNGIKEMYEVKKEREKSSSGSKDTFHCKNGKSLRTDEVKTSKRKTTEKLELKENKKACLNDVLSTALGSKVSRVTATECEKLENKVKLSLPTKCDIPSSFSVCSTASQHGVKNTQETKLALTKRKEKCMEKVKQKSKEEVYCKSKTRMLAVKSDKNSFIGSNIIELDERKRGKEGKEDDKVRLKNKENQEDGCSESKKLKKDTVVDNHFSSSSPENGYGEVETETFPSSMNHEQRINREEHEPILNSNIDLENPVHDEVMSTDRCQAVDSQDTRCHSPDYYLNEAKKLKHEADKEITLTIQAVKYLEAVCNFMLTGNAMEHNHFDGERIYIMYKETLDLLRCIWLKFQKMHHSSSSCSLDKRLTVLSLRCQSLLYYKLYQLRRPEVHELQKSINEYHKTGRLSSHQSPLPSSSHTPNPGCRFSQPSPLQPKSCSGTIKDGIASPHSPTPSPAGSVASVGSQSSGYISCEVNGVGTAVSQTRSVSAVAMPSSVSSHAGPLRPCGSSLTTISISQHLYNLLQKQNAHLTNLHMCHELWEQARYLIVHCNSQDFFAALDSNFDQISLDTPLIDLVHYVQAGLSKLRDMF
ncbi:uncharacterized protein LOC143240951 isoform X2 [Tachypleus tridentatus]|uniref:uncharacterized protein LOC143240951 isoform X2 n=1 Tax=Tachypleus tridentatus TaxID=6853 RepID=UPI003FD4DFC5